MQRHLLIFLLCLLAGIAGAQKFNGGVLLGGNVSQVDGDYLVGYHKFGFQAGGVVSLQLSRHSTFQLELEYIQKGSRGNSDSTNTGNTFLMRLNYIEIPVFYQYYFIPRFGLEGGLAADILFSHIEKSGGLESESTVPYRPVNLCGILGVNGFITKRLMINFRFSYSLISIHTTKDVTFPPSYRHILFETGQYNNVLQLSLIYMFKENENIGR